MTQQKQTKKSLLASGLSLLACVALLIGSTFAWFTDNVTSGRNQITAGNLDVELYARDTDGVYQPVNENEALFDDAALWEPGHTEVVYLKVANEGTLALKYQLTVTVASETSGTNVDGEAFNLSDYLVFGQAAGATETIYNTRADAQAAAGEQMGLNDYTKPGNLTDGEEEYIALVVYMPEGVDNKANYKTGTTAPSIELGVDLVATQDTVESDSFGKDYDEKAPLSSVSIQGIAGLENRTFRTIQEAYAAGNEVVKALGLGQEAASDDQFDAIYTDDGRITWTIHGTQTLANNQRILTFGRASNRYSSTRSIQEIRVVGGDTNAKLNLQSVGLPYAWWNDEEDALTVRFENLDMKAMGDGQISCSRAFGAPLKVYFDNCNIAGRIYHYFNAEGTISVTNCHFTDNGTNGYAFFVQGSETEPLTVDFSNNEVVGFTRGINIQQKTAVVTIKGNIITSTNSEPDRGALQLTDAATCTVEGNTIDVNDGNAIWFHSAATNDQVKYIINNNTIKAPYLINDDTSFGISSHITSSGNTLDIEYEGLCMEKDQTVASESTVTLN